MKQSFNMENQGKEGSEKKPAAAGKIGDTPIPKKENASISSDQLAEILEAQRKSAEMIASLNRRLDEATKQNQGSDMLNAIRELTGKKTEVDKSKVFDPADFHKEGVTFYYYGFMTVLSSDRRMDQEVLAPFGPIVFQNLAGISRQEGKEQNILYLSGYTSHRKSEIEWIREHTWCVNGLITEKADINVTKKQVARSQRAAKYLGSIQAYAPSRVMQECASNGIDISGSQTDLQACRAALVDYYVDKEINEEYKRQESALKEHGRDKHLEQVNALA